MHRGGKGWEGNPTHISAKSEASIHGGELAAERQPMQQGGASFVAAGEQVRVVHRSFCKGSGAQLAGFRFEEEVVEVHASLAAAR